jgi:hypothetical protein
MITFSLNWIAVLTFVISIFLPLLVGLVTKLTTSAGVRAILLAFLAAVAGFLTELLSALTNGTPYDVGLALLLWIGTFVVAVASHFGIWKPTGVSESAKAAFGGDRTNAV